MLVNTLCRAIERDLAGLVPPIAWPADQRRLRCFGHIINIGVNAFLFKQDPDAVEYAIELAGRAGRPIEEEFAQGEGKSRGWTKEAAMQKLDGFIMALGSSSDLYNGFLERNQGRTIHRPNDTRWNSWFDAIDDALALRDEYNGFVAKEEQLREFELTITDWSSLEQTHNFLGPFKEVVKRCEGDYVTLDQLQESMDFLVSHYKEQMTMQAPNTGLRAAIATSWYAFDKYYQKLDTVGIYVAALLLHPGRRRAYLEAEWKRDWIAPALRRARELWKEKYEGMPHEDEPSLAAPSVTHELSQFELWRRSVKDKQKAKDKLDEFDHFVKASPEDIEMPVLRWWLQPAIQKTYPTLWRMAVDCLSAAAMSADSERVFSGTRRTISYDRSTLTSAHIAELETQKQWKVPGLPDMSYTDE